MILSILKVSIAISTIFSITAFSTAKISKSITNGNSIKANTNIDEEEEEEEDYIPSRNLTDTEEFINSLTGFGNLRGDIYSDITVDDTVVCLQGEAFVSLESLDDVQIDVDLDVYYSSVCLSLECTYVDNTIFLSIGDENVKLETSNIGDIVEMINSFNLPVELPEMFSNIDTSELLNNLGNMTSVKDEDQITYTCNLLPGLAPIIFTSTLDYKMTSISIFNAEIEGINITLTADIDILGKGHNEIVNPETEDKTYADIANYLGIISQVGNYLNTKQFGLSYNLDLISQDDKKISLLGSANIDLNTMSIGIDGKVNLNNTNINFNAAYLNDVIYFDYDNIIKLSYSSNKIQDLITCITTNFNLPSIANILEVLKLDDMPLMKLISSKDYLSLFDYYHDIELSDNSISIFISNSLFGEDTSNIEIKMLLNDGMLSSISIENLIINNIKSSLTISLKNYSRIYINKSLYTSIDDADILLNNIVSIMNKDKFNISLNADVTNNDGTTSINGSTQFDLTTKNAFANLELVTSSNDKHNIGMDLYEGENLYLSYNDTINVSTKISSCVDFLDTIVDFATNHKDLLNDLIQNKLVNFTSGTIQKIIGGDYLAIISDKIINKFTHTSNNYHIEIDGELINEESPIIIDLNLNDDVIESLTISLTVLSNDIDINLTLNEYNENYEHINISNINFYELNDFSLFNKLLDASNFINPIVDIINQDQIGLSFDLIAKENNSIVTDIFGNANIDLSNFNVNLDGIIKLNDINTYLDITYINDVVYLNLDDFLKASYSKDSIVDLIDVINSNVTIPSINELLSNVLSTDSKLLEIITNQEFLLFIDYINDINVTKDKISITIDGSLLGNDTSDITIDITFSNDKLDEIMINNLNIADYNFSLRLYQNDYENITLPNDIDTYSSLDSCTTLIENIFSFIDQDKYALTLSGNISSNNTATNISGTTQFDLSNVSGSANLVISDNSNNNHNIAIDLYDDEQLYFTYNNNLNGKLTINSINDIISLIESITAGENKRLDKWKDMLLSDDSNSLINDALNGDFVSLINSKIIQQITYDNNGLTIQIDGKIINETSPIVVKLNTVDNEIDSLDISLTFNDTSISLTLNIVSWNENYNKIDIANTSFYDFSDISSLIDYLFTTAECNDFSISGTLNLDLDIIKIFSKEFNIDVDIKVHINDDETVISCITFDNIPHLSSLIQSEDWDKRTFKIYMGDDYVNLYNETIYDYDEMTGFFKWTDYRKTTTNTVHLTMEQFLDDIIYYFVNFGLGIDEIDLSDTTSESDSTIDYSKILTGFNYALNGDTPTWNIGINLPELIGNDMIGILNATLTGNASTKIFTKFIVSLPVDVYGILDLDVNLDATMDSVDTLPSETIDFINDFNAICLTQNEKEIISNSSTIEI